jgi:hypothetical protein
VALAWNLEARREGGRAGDPGNAGIPPQTSVGVAAGIQGHLGPYHIDGSASVEISLDDHGVEPFADLSIGAGPMSCSLKPQ